MFKDYINLLMSTNSGWVGLILRLTLGIVIFPHVTGKLFSWFNGPGIKGEIKAMTEHIGLPTHLAITAILVECTGWLLIVTGTATRLSALVYLVYFTCIISIVHYPNGFFMNFFGKLPAGKEGFEFHLLILGICIALIVEGGGKFSIDEMLQPVTHFHSPPVIKH